MQRGLPRPTTASDLPIPYLASGADALGKRSHSRYIEVYENDLCQVCGEPAGFPVFGVIAWTGQPESRSVGLIDHGLLHERCARLALLNCPALSACNQKALVRVDRTDIERGASGIVLVPPRSQAGCRVDVDTYRVLDPRDDS